MDGALTTGLGLLGFGTILVSTAMPTRRRLLLADMVGNIAVALHYALLGAGAGAAFSAAYAAMDVIAHDSSQRVRVSGAAVVMAAASIVVVLSEPAWTGALALVATSIAVLARLLLRTSTMLLLIAVSTVLWGVYGAVSGSTPQVAFSAVYSVMALVGFVRRRAAGDRVAGWPHTTAQVLPVDDPDSTDGPTRTPRDSDG